MNKTYRLPGRHVVGLKHTPYDNRTQALPEML